MKDIPFETQKPKPSPNIALVNASAERMGMSRQLHRSEAELIKATGRDAIGEKVLKNDN
jgi:hypothetical protein